MIVELEYGRDKLPVTLDDDYDVTVIRKEPLRVIDDPSAAVTTALAKPVSAPALFELAQGKQSACIVICDITRPVPNHLFLRPMIEQLMAAGMAADAICVLIATGLHRPNEGEELAELVGDPWVLENIAVENHFARDDAAHIDLGRTSTRNTPVKLDRRFVEADLKIATGLVEPHFMAGYSGGRKVIAPGIAHQDTIRTFHNAKFMEDPAATQCNLEGNPLHEEQLEILGMLGDVFAVNTIIDESRQLAFINFGEIVESHLQSVQFVHKACQVQVDRRFQTVVTSSAGHPLDKNYYQTVKGMVTPIDILDDGASLIVASKCADGLGSPEFRESQQRLIQLGMDGFLNSILDKPFADVDEWQTEMQLKPMRRAKIHLYSDALSDADHELTGVERIDSVESAIADSVRRTGNSAVAIIPEGPYVVPQYSRR